MRTLLVYILLLWTSLLFAQTEEPYYHRVKAEPGDYTTSLLKRYHLEEHQCNFEKFYELNGLTKESTLRQGQKYTIPVIIYRYNGKSIQTSVGFDGWEAPYRVKKYNAQILSEGLRRKKLVTSKIIWVPHHELYCTKGQTKPSVTTPTPEEQPLVETPKEEKPQEKDTVAATKTEERIPPTYEPISSTVLDREAAMGGYRKFPIFGAKDAFIPLRSNKLRGQIFYIVSGHGGPDSGAVGKRNGNQLCEDEYAYDISLRLVRKLLEHGAIAYMITRDPNDGLRDGAYLPCDQDEYCWGNYKIPRSQKNRLFQRSDAINTLYERHAKQGVTEQTMVSIHIDSRNTSERTDVFFYYFPGSKSGRKLAKKMQRTLGEKYKKYRKNRKYYGTVTARDLHILREVKANSVFIELGNIRNPSDQQRFVMVSNRQFLADWLFEGLTQ